MSSAPFNIILRGTTDSNGNFTVNLLPPPGLQGKCSVRPASWFVDGTSSYELKLKWGGFGKSYDTGTTGISETLLVNTSQASSPPTVFRDLPTGPCQVTVQVLLAATGTAASSLAVSLQLQVTPDHM